MLLVGYIIFAFSNLGALLLTFYQQRVLGAAIEKTLKSDPTNNLSDLAANCSHAASFRVSDLIGQLTPLGNKCAVGVASENGLILFYGVFALLTIFGIFTIPRTLPQDDAIS
jgi:hypothetical protein